VPFVLDYRPAAQSFLDGLKLNRGGRLRLFHMLQDLRNVSDAERADPAKRLGPFFVFRRAFRDKRRLLTIRLIVDDGPAVIGVLRVVYADLA
jgi:hypothetical protein